MRNNRKQSRRSNGPFDWLSDIGDVFGGEPINLLLLFISIVVGVGAYLLCSLIYGNYLMLMPRPVLIGLMFAILSTVLVAIIHILSKIRDTYADDVTEDYLPFADKPIIVLIIAVVVISLFAGLFQFIYGFGATEKQSKPTSYVFVIDDSGSMEGNDPQQLRYSAINEILQEQPEDFPYMIYSFSNGSQILRDMAPKSQGSDKLEGNSEGGTEIKGALQTVIADYKSGTWSGGDSPKVVMLTDGHATDMHFGFRVNGTLNEYRKEGITISTVGLGNVDDNLMNRIAKRTGGVFIGVENASQLSNAMKNAATMQTERDLLSTRYTENMNVLYAIMRIVFLLILGLLIGMAAYIAYGDEESKPLAFLTTAITSFIGALVMELGTNAFSFDDGWVWLILWVLFAFTLMLRHVKVVRGVGTAIAPTSGTGTASANIDRTRTAGSGRNTTSRPRHGGVKRR